MYVLNKLLLMVIPPITSVIKLNKLSTKIQIKLEHSVYTEMFNVTFSS